MAEKERHDLGPILENAYSKGAGCPPPEAFLAAELESMTAEERAVLEAHAVECPACAAERELAAAFDTVPDVMGDADVSPIVSRLEGAMSQHLSSSARQATSKTRLARWAPRLAAAAVLVLAVGTLFRVLQPGPPPLPRGTGSDIARGSIVQLVDPVGELEALPNEFVWRSVPGAASYNVKLLTVADEILWSESVSNLTVPLPDSLIQELQPMVTYYWSVDAFDETGARLARSRRTNFRVNAMETP